VNRDLFSSFLSLLQNDVATEKRLVEPETETENEPAETATGLDASSETVKRNVERVSFESLLQRYRGPYQPKCKHLNFVFNFAFPFPISISIIIIDS
jgi:hypothetical protein